MKVFKYKIPKESVVDMPNTLYGVQPKEKINKIILSNYCWNLIAVIIANSSDVCDEEKLLVLLLHSDKVQGVSKPCPPSRAQVAEPWVKSTIFGWNTSNLKLICQGRITTIHLCGF